jgi:iron only hydrogenase large subunit-like protein
MCINGGGQHRKKGKEKSHIERTAKVFSRDEKAFRALRVSQQFLEERVEDVAQGKDEFLGILSVLTQLNTFDSFINTLSLR